MQPEPPKLQRTASTLKLKVGDHVEVVDAYQNLHDWPIDSGSLQWRFVIKELHETEEDKEEPKATIKRLTNTTDGETEVAHMNNNMGPEINTLPRNLSPALYR